MGCGNDTRTLPSTNAPNFHTLVRRPPASMSDSYENDATQPQKCLNTTAPALVIPAPQSSFRRRPESRGVGGGKTAASLGTKIR